MTGNEQVQQWTADNRQAAQHTALFMFTERMFMPLDVKGNLHYYNILLLLEMLLMIIQILSYARLTIPLEVPAYRPK